MAQTYSGLSHKTFHKTIDDIGALVISIKYCLRSNASDLSILLGETTKIEEPIDKRRHTDIS